MILLVVLVVVSIAAFVGVSATYMARAEIEGATGSMRRVQSRALAWSGVQGVMAELAQQREGILRGDAPSITEEWELYTDASGRRAIVRIIASPGGKAVTSEQMRVDVNTATANMLSALEIDESIVQAILAARDRRPFGSVAELLQVEGVTPELLFGDGWDRADADGQPEDDWPGTGSGTGSATGLPDEGLTPSGPPRLADRLTVFSFDPNMQAGLGQQGGDHQGRRRINLNTSWNDELEQAIAERFGQPAANGARAILANRKVEKLGEVLTIGLTAGANARDLTGQLDAFTVVDGPYVQGLIDLNLASAEVLACIPGIGADAAARIVEVREGLSQETSQSIIWPQIEGILTSQDMILAVDHLTARSSQWRVMLEGGYTPAGDGQSWDDLAGVELSDRVVLEAVIDIAGSRPRVAYLRDVTLLGVARQLAGRAGAMIEAEEEAYRVIDERQVPADDLELPTAAGRGPGRGPGRGGGNRSPGATIPEPPVQGPIEPDAEVRESAAGGSAAGDQRIGRWTPGPARKEEGR